MLELGVDHMEVNKCNGRKNKHGQKIAARDQEECQVQWQEDQEHRVRRVSSESNNDGWRRDRMMM